MKRLSYVLIALFVLQMAFVAPSMGQSTTKDYYILFDEAHYQFIDHNLMSTALDSLSNAFSGVNVHVVPIKDKFNETNLQGADLVIIGNPGVNSENNIISVSDTEKKALEDLVDNGGSVLYMSNPYSLNRSLTGHARPLNDLIVTGLDASIHKSPIDSDNVTIVVDDFNNDKNNTHVIINKNNFNDKTLYTETNNITLNSDILYYGTFVELTAGYQPEIYGNTSEYAYIVDQDYEALPSTIQTGPTWLVADKSDNDDVKGRYMLMGSTIMFSDLPYNSGEKWIDQMNNLEFFQNMIAWLLKITPQQDESPIVSNQFSFFMQFNLYAATGIAIALGIIWFGYLIYKGRLSITGIFKIRDEKSGKSHSEKPSEKSKKKHKSKKKKARS